ncbi:MAG: phenylalanine--tRNA ligase subunit beta [Anaerolineales bacterium]|nr:phenylalanine--tRNA ligase subunit beta [Anaerolineales bacterium]
MRVPLSWLKEYVTITISAEELAERLTLAGLEVKQLDYLGVPQGIAPEGITVPPSDHLVWNPKKIVLGAIHEVKAHPNADRLVLALVDHGTGELDQVVTGAPNLFPYKDKGKIDPPLYAPFAREGAEVYDGHAEGRVRMVLKEKPLRGIPNKHMVCSAKELGLGGDHEGILLLDADSIPTTAAGTPLVDVLGDVIFEIDLTPNLARAYGIIGVAREVAALTGQTLREPDYGRVVATGGDIGEAITVAIKDSYLNPRFCGMVIRSLQIKPSPQWLRRRLEAVGVRSINNIVDVTNYVMFETGQPLHAFDYDVLQQRAGGGIPAIITRTASPGETLKTLDGVDRTLDEQTILVCDALGVLGLGGIMGGDESEIKPDTRNVFLEAANWNYINVRRTMTVQKMSTEAGVRFSRGIHPAQSERGVRRAAEMMRLLGDGEVLAGMIDVHPAPAPVIRVDLPLREVERLIGISLSAGEISGILTRLQFTVEPLDEQTLRVTVPDHRVDIATGVVGAADIVEEVARIYGYDRIPDTLIEDMLPPQANNDELTREDRVRDLLAEAGLREVINYRLTTPEAEARLIAPGESAPEINGAAYVRLANPISLDKTVLRHTLLNGVLENIVRNARHSVRQRLFEIGSVYRSLEGAALPDEPRHLALALTGARRVATWQEGKDVDRADVAGFFDLKGVLEALVKGLRLPAGALTFKRGEHPTFHPGRCAAVYLRETLIGYAGELHPLVAAAYDLEQTVAAAELRLDPLIADLPRVDRITPILTTPPVYQDIALIVGEKTPADDVERVILAAGGDLLRGVRLFDVYRGDPIPAGKKSLAYALTFQAEDRTLTDGEVAKAQAKIVKAAERELGAALRGG